MNTASLGAVVGFVRRVAVRGPLAPADHELLERFALQRDEAAFAELVRRHGPMVLASCRRVLRHEQDAEDVFQATFLVLAQRAVSIRQSESLPGWLHQVAYRLALRARAVNQRRREQAMPAHEPAALRTGDALAFDEELSRLPEPYRAAVVLCYLEGHSQHEAAHILATTADAVNSRLKRARALLRSRYGCDALVVAAIAGAAGSARALSAEAIAQTTRAAIAYAAGASGSLAASNLAVSLAKGAFPMFSTTMRWMTVCLGMAICLFVGLFAASTATPADPPTPQSPPAALVQAKKEQQPVGGDKKKPHRACIILWMTGGPSQLDTFDPKQGNVALFPAIDTAVKGMQFSKHLPLLAKQAKHLAVIRGMKHPEGDHYRGSYLMRTGFSVDGGARRPTLGSLLARELEANPDLPRYVRIWDDYRKEKSAGFLHAKYGPVIVTGQGGIAPGKPVLPGAKAFDAIAPKDADAMRKALAKPFDVDAEPAKTRAAYGANAFGQGCLLARRLIDAGVPVVEVTMQGWDTHTAADKSMPRLCAALDAGMANLIKDLDKSGRLKDTVIVWMGEFGRTPRVNASTGRDHWPRGFSVVLAGGGIKGGQAIGKTGDDGFKVLAGAVTPAELHATIYQALGIDSAKTIRVPKIGDVPLVPKGTAAVKAALR